MDLFTYDEGGIPVMGSVSESYLDVMTAYSNLFKDKKPSLLNFFLTHLLLNFLSRPDFIAYNGHYPSLPSIRLCRRLGADGVQWTLDSREALEAVHKNGEQAIYENIELS